MFSEQDRSESDTSAESMEKEQLEANHAARQRLEADQSEQLLPRHHGEVTSDGDRIAIQRLREQSDADFACAHRDLIDDTAKNRITFSESSDEMVDARRIAPSRITDLGHSAEAKDFWHEHGNTRDDYFRLGEKYRDIRGRLNEGSSLEDLGRDKDLGDAVKFWYAKDGHDQIELEEYKGSYFIDKGHHRVELAQMLDLGEIPARVRHARPKGGES